GSARSVAIRPRPVSSRPLRRFSVGEVANTMKLAFLLWMASILPQPASDQICLASTIYLEARSESARGQMAVAEVALRRRESGRWGHSVCDVVNAPGQFALSHTSRNFVFDTPRAWEKAWTIAGRALDMWSLPREQRKFV